MEMDISSLTFHYLTETPWFSYALSEVFRSFLRENFPRIFGHFLMGTLERSTSKYVEYLKNVHNPQDSSIIFTITTQTTVLFSSEFIFTSKSSKWTKYTKMARWRLWIHLRFWQILSDFMIMNCFFIPISLRKQWLIFSNMVRKHAKWDIFSDFLHIAVNDY